ncbi:MAG: helix-hairpin-helix domain-containing protein [Muricomes sp.]
MKDRKNAGIRKFLYVIFASVILAAGCSRDKADDLTELESGQTADGKLETAEESSEHDAGSTGENHVQKQKESEMVFVYVCGAVKAPGVYELTGDARVYEAVAMAGGVTEAAAGDAVNQARVVADGERIYIPTAQEVEKGIVDGYTPEVTGTDRKTEGKININTALKEELKTLPGIGDAKADSIISHRESNGPFQSVEDLMLIEGIKEGVFDKIKDRITV